MHRTGHKKSKSSCALFLCQMANKKYKSQPDKSTEKTDKKSDVVVQDLLEQYRRSFDAQNAFRETLDEKEALLIGDVLDKESQESAKSRIFDPRLSTIVWDRASRVTATVPRGQVQAMSKNDLSPSRLMQLILDKYVYPNARTDWALDVKTKLFDFYSLVYGSMCVITDYVVSKEYTGPDYRLIPVRDIVPQSGRSNIQSCDYVFVRSVVSRKWLAGRDQKNWKNIDKLFENTAKRTPSNDEQSYVERKFDSDNIMSSIRNDREDVELITKYECDKWTTFSRDGKIIVREIENPHGNNRIPIIKKDCFPLMDRFFGMGEFERGKSLQYAVNSLINLYMDGVKMSIFPPMTVYLPDIMPETLVAEPGAMFMLKSPNPNAIRPVDISPRGIDTFQSTYQFLNGAIQFAAGTTDTAVGKDFDSNWGRTPAAIRMQASRQNARDNWDRQMLETAMEEVFDNFVDLISKKQVKPIRMTLGKDELARISELNPDLVEMFESGKYGEVTIKPEMIKGHTYKFFIEHGSSMKPSSQEEGAMLKELMAMLLKFPQFVQQVAESGDITLGAYKVNVGELMKRIIITDNVTDWEKILTRNENYEQQQHEREMREMKFNDEVLDNMWQQMQGGQPQGGQQGGVPQGMGGVSSSQIPNEQIPGGGIADQSNYTAVQDYTGTGFGEGLV